MRATRATRHGSSRSLICFLSAAVVCAMSQSSRVGAAGGLIRIYQRLVPHARANQSASQLERQATTVHSVPLESGGSESGDLQNNQQASIEYTSPMKRIMDLIGHHAPVIVVKSDGQDADEQAAAMRQQADEQQQPQQQHWTVLDGGQIVQQPLAALPQQQVQASVPFEQYYTFTPSHFAAEPVANQITVLPSGASLVGGFAPAQAQFGSNSPQVVQTTQSSQNYLSSADQSSLDQLNNQAQPVFLSSYVPEIPVQQQQQQQPNMRNLIVAGGVGGAVNSFAPAAQPSGLAGPQPSSIQQVQRQQQQGPISDGGGAPPEGDKTSDDETPETPSDRSSSPSSGAGDDDNGAGPADEAEPQSRSSRKADSENPDEPNSSNSGSLSYEDKYDSDKDGDQQQQSAPSSNKYKAQEPAASQSLANGLINVGLNDDCLQCICRASTGCDHLLQCITSGAQEVVCGPYGLTEEYWQKAGKPRDSPNNFSSFEDCAIDEDCAAETVTSYMRKYRHDCDGDDNITCMDYARLHRLPKHECTDTDKLTSNFNDYWAKFQHCAAGYNKTRNGDDENI